MKIETRAEIYASAIRAAQAYYLSNPSVVYGVNGEVFKHLEVAEQAAYWLTFYALGSGLYFSEEVLEIR